MSSELGGIRVEDGAIRVGAGVRQAELLAWPELAGHQPLLAQALPWIGHWQTRARGTVCGSIALADPSAEMPLVLAALGGEIVLSSKKGRRNVSADHFFTGLMSTVRNDDELIEAVSFPCRRNGEGFAFREFARRHGDFAIVACAAVATEKNVRLAIGGVADRPIVRDLDDTSDETLAGFAQSSTRATTCTRPPITAAIWCAVSAASPSTRRADAAPERRRAPHRAPRRSTAAPWKARPSRACCSPISCVTSSASPARMSAASTVCAAPARSRSTARRRAPA